MLKKAIPDLKITVPVSVLLSCLWTFVEVAKTSNLGRLLCLPIVSTDRLTRAFERADRQGTTATDVNSFGTLFCSHSVAVTCSDDGLCTYIRSLDPHRMGVHLERNVSSGQITAHHVLPAFAVHTSQVNHYADGAAGRGLIHTTSVFSVSRAGVIEAVSTKCT